MMHQLFLLAFLASLSIISAQQISPACLRDVQRTLKAAIVDREVWALRMIDASTKFPDGLLFGHWGHLGHWDECLSVRSPDSLIRGQHCRVTLIGFFNDTTPRIRASTSETTKALRASVCTPASCDAQDVSLLVTGATLIVAPQVPSVALVDGDECFTEESAHPPLGTWAIVFLGATGVLALGLLVSTVLHVCGRGNELINQLSAVAITRRLLNVSQGSLGCLNGLKVLSMLWVLLGHKYESFVFVPLSNALQVVPYLRQTAFMMVANAFISVDSFFFIGGFLLGHGFFKSSRQQPFDALKFYLYRYLRLTAPLAVMIAFYLTVIDHLGSGPVWRSMVSMRHVDFCVHNWWQAITYVNNYVGIEKQCVEQTWYTSVDMQLAVLSPLLLLPLVHSPRAGKQLGVLLLILSCALPGVITYLNNYPWTVDLVNDYFDYEGFNREVYLPTHTRATPYIVGILLAYFMQNHNAKTLKLKKWMIALGWILCTGTCLAVLFTVVLSYQEDYVPDPISAGFYAGLHRLGWSLGLAWIVFACTNGLGGPVNAILAWNFFGPLSALTYGAYLTHLVVIGPVMGVTKTSTYISNYEVVHGFFSDLPFVLIASCILHYLVEAPVMVLLRYLFKNDRAAERRRRQVRGGGSGSEDAKTV